MVGAVPVAVAAKGREAEQAPASLLTLIGVGQVIVGEVQACIVNWK